jgi:hypothetical protein
MDYVFVQVQDISGNWRTISQIPNIDQMIIAEMQNIKDQFPKQRVRTVDSVGRMIDILP